MFHYDLIIDGAATIGVDIFSMPTLDSRMYVFRLSPITVESEFDTDGHADCSHSETEDERRLLIIDPVLIAKEDEPVLRALCRQASHATVLVTHSHYDHIAGLNRLRELLPVTVYATPLCDRKLQDPRRNLAAYSMALIMGKYPKWEWYCQTHFDFDYSCQADELYEESLELRFNLTGDDSDRTLLIRTTPAPGHSDCSQCIELWVEPATGGIPDPSTGQETSGSDAPGHPDRFLAAVFTGDSLVNGHDVITRFPTGNKRVFREQTEPYLLSLPDEITIFPGHGDPAPLESLREWAII